MIPSERRAFFDVVNRALGAYLKFPTELELEAWWDECKGLTIEALATALKSHKDDADRGERAPRPSDITRRMKVGARDASRCAAVDSSGQCEYPGIFSDGTSGEGRWWCPWHRTDRAGPEASRWIAVSREVSYEEARAKRMERMAEQAARAPGVVERAHDIAKRHGNRPWQSSTPRFKLPE